MAVVRCHHRRRHVAAAPPSVREGSAMHTHATESRKDTHSRLRPHASHHAIIRKERGCDHDTSTNVCVILSWWRVFLCWCRAADEAEPFAATNNNQPTSDDPVGYGRRSSSTGGGGGRLSGEQACMWLVVPSIHPCPLLHGQRDRETERGRGPIKQPPTTTSHTPLTVRKFKVRTLCRSDPLLLYHHSNNTRSLI